MKTIIHVNGDTTNASIVGDLPREWFEGDGRTDELYTFICETFSKNEWVDIVCEKVEHNDNCITVDVRVY
jgi:hypothetical protein